MEQVEIRLDPVKQPVADGLRQYPPVLTIESPSASVIRTGQPYLGTEVPHEMLRRGAQSDRHLSLLESSPEIGRPVGDPPLRELVIPFGDAGYVALYRHEPGDDAVYVLAFRHQRETGYP